MIRLSFCVSPDATASHHDDGMVILNASNGFLYTSNRIGSCIWRGIERRVPLETIASEISDAYQMAKSIACEHTQRFVSELERHALVRREMTR
jgi:hypothetical protein